MRQNKKRLKRILTYVLVTALVCNASLFYLNAQAESETAAQKTPEELGYIGVSLGDFNLEAGTYKSTDAKTHRADFYKGDSLHNTYLDIDVAFTLDQGQNNETSFRYLSADGWSGLQIGADANNLYIQDALVGKPDSYSVSALGLNSLSERFNMKLGTKLGRTYTNASGKTVRDIQYTLWINDILVVNEVEIQGIVIGKQLGIYTPNGGIVVAIPEKYASNDVIQKTPEELGYTIGVTLGDFNLVGGTYKSTDSKVHRADVYKGTDLNNTYLNMDISFAMNEGQTLDTSFRYLSENGWAGLQFGADSDGFKIQDALVGNAKVYSSKQLGVDSLKDTFNLKLGTRFSDVYTNESGKQVRDITYTFWINDVLIDKDVRITGMANTGMQLGIYTPNGGITVHSPESKLEQKTPEELGFTGISLKSFGLEARTYKSTDSPNYVAGEYDKKSLDKTYLDVDVSFGMTEGQNQESSFRHLSANGWSGLQIGATVDGLSIMDASVGNPIIYSLEKLGLDSLSETFNMKLGTRMQANGELLDITYTLWINDVLIARDVELKGVANTGKQLGIYTPKGSITVGIPERYNVVVRPQQNTPEELGYTGINLKAFGIAPGPYKSTDKQNYTSGNFAGSTLNKKYLDVNLSFGVTKDQDRGTSLRYLSADGWAGIQIGADQAGLYIMDASVGKAAFYSLSTLGLKNMKVTFNMKFATKFGAEYKNADGVMVRDVTYTLWINDVLIAKDVELYGVAKTGNCLGIYAPQGSITVGIPNDNITVSPKKLPKDYRELTFKSFQLKDTKFEYTGEALPSVKGTTVYSFDKTLFSGDVFFHGGRGADLRYGCYDSVGWTGLQFYPTDNGDIQMAGVASSGYVTDTYKFRPYTAGVDLTETWFNFKISIRYMDYDKDGIKDDVELGVWFNNVLYDNNYIYLTDYTQYLGNGLSTYVEKPGTYVQIRSDKSVYTGVDFTLYGFTMNWQKELGLK